MIGTRVRAEPAGVVGALEGWRPDLRRAYVDGRVLEDVESLTPAPLVCVRCSSDVLRLFTGDLCANCTRYDAAVARNTNSDTQPCDDCGQVGGVSRNPRGRRNEYYCGACAQVRGALVADGYVERLAAACLGRDVNDASHDLVLVKSSITCRRCKLKVHGPSKAPEAYARLLEKRA